MQRRSFLCWILVASIARAAVAAEHPITVDEVINGPIIGSLDKPLGTMVVITAEGGKPSKDSGTKIISAEGRLLENPLGIPLVQNVSSDVAFKPDEVYELLGFESGAFGGSPPATHGLQPQQPFQFHHFFVVVKIIKPDSDAAATVDAICKIAFDGGGDENLAEAYGAARRPSSAGECPSRVSPTAQTCFRRRLRSLANCCVPGPCRYCRPAR